MKDSVRDLWLQLITVMGGKQAEDFVIKIISAKIKELEIPKPHIHAGEMLLYAMDATKTAEPWLLWECNDPNRKPNQWLALHKQPMWVDHILYRRILA